MRIQILDEVEEDLQDRRDFKDRREPNSGGYFAAALASDIDLLILLAGIHSTGSLEVIGESGKVLQDLLI